MASKAEETSQMAIYNNIANKKHSTQVQQQHGSSGKYGASSSISGLSKQYQGQP